jgi:hypothetical protein
MGNCGIPVGITSAGWASRKPRLGAIALKAAVGSGWLSVTEAEVGVSTPAHVASSGVASASTAKTRSRREEDGFTAMFLYHGQVVGAREA